MGWTTAAILMLALGALAQEPAEERPREQKARSEKRDAGKEKQGDGEQQREEKEPGQEEAVEERQKPRYAVVVHASNRTQEADDAQRALIKKLYLKDLTRWPDGSLARPYARDADSEAQRAFARKVLGMSEAELARHWLRIKNLHGTTPPREVAPGRLVLKHVAHKPGSFTIVERGEIADAEGVRVLFEF